MEVDNLDDILTSVKQEIRRATVDHKHPFRYVILGTGADSISMRHVVLRKVDDQFNLMIYTDSRTQKVDQINQNQQCQLLFYHPRKKVQVKVSCVATICQNDEVTRKHWLNVLGENQKAYCSVKAPGDPINSPIEAFEWDDGFSSKYFTVLSLSPTQIEILQIRGAEHLRVIFKQIKEWSGQWLVP